jgi:hypothetical protein
MFMLELLAVSTLCLWHVPIKKFVRKSSIFWDITPSTDVDFHRTTWRYIPEDRTVHNRRSENSKSLKYVYINKYIYCHVFSDCRRGIGSPTGFIGLQQCCPTFLYIGAHLTDGCGGAGAMWRLQQQQQQQQ